MNPDDDWEPARGIVTAIALVVPFWALVFLLVWLVAR